MESGQLSIHTHTNKSKKKKTKKFIATLCTKYKYITVELYDVQSNSASSIYIGSNKNKWRKNRKHQGKEEQ